MKLSYFPNDKYPLGITGAFDLNRYYTFSDSYIPCDRDCGNEPSDKLYNSDYRDCYNEIKITNRLSKYLLGIKLSNQQFRSWFNPYFSASIGMVISKSKIKELEWDVWEVESVDELGETIYNENGYPVYETESASSVKQKQTLLRSKRLIYSYEGGIELFSQNDSPLIIYLAVGYVGSINSFTLINEFQSVEKNNFDAIKSDFTNNAIINKSRLSMWQFSFGLTFRI